MKKGNCAYCGCEFDKSNHRRTKEHIIPRGLIELFPEQYISFTKDKNFIDNNGITINDVCAHCNNIILSDFDAYGKKLIKEFFCSALDTENEEDGYEITIDYILLSKWLLKIIFNNMRQQRVNYGWFDIAIPYIIDDIRITNINFSIYLGKHINVSPLPEEFFNYMPIQINRDPKLLRKSLNTSVFGGDPYQGMIKLNQAHDSYVMRFGSAIFYVILWKKEADPEDIKSEEKILSEEFNFKRIDGTTQVYKIHRVTANSNLGFGYTHLLTNSALKQDDLYVEQTLNKRKAKDLRDELLTSKPYKERDKARTLVEMLMFPNNKSVERKYEEKWGMI